MKLIRDNLTYIFLGLIALVLIFITISLQTSILATQNPASTEEDAGVLVTLRRQIGEWILPNAPDADAPAASTDGVQATGDSNTVTTGAAGPTTAVTTAAQGVDDAVDRVAAESNSSPAGTEALAALYNAQNLTISDDYAILASVVGSNANAVGLFHHAYYLEHQDQLRAVAIRLPSGEVVPPDAAAVAAGLYPLARPLYLYTSPTVMHAKPALEALLGCFLNGLPQTVGASGYLVPSRQLFTQALQSFDATCQRCRREATTTHPLAEIVPACDFADVPFSDIAITGSTAVAPLALQMAAQARAGGYLGMVTVASTTTGAGFATFCADGGGDVVAASRAANGDERERCRAAGRSLLPFPIAVDALTVAVSRENLFLQSVTIQELQQIVVYARTWSDLNPQWPNDPILRALPGMQSGTAAYFVEAVMEEEALAQLAERRNQPLSSLPEVSATNDQRDTTVRPTVGNVVGTTVFIDKSPRVRIGYVEEGGEEGEARGPACAFVTEAMGLILAENFGLQVELRAFPDADELFATLAAKTPEARVDLTFCYLDPLDRSYRQRYFGYTEFIDSGYRQIGENRLVIMTNSVVKPALERENRCLYQFLDALSLEGMPLSGQTPSDWYVQNQATIDAWLPCE